MTASGALHPFWKRKTSPGNTRRLLSPEEILVKYWGYQQFRNPQREIIQSALENQDILALMPTGGGKSLCYQVPGLAREGVTLVISPLIALMQDQVAQLRRREILAIAIHSGMSRNEIDITLDNAIYGKYKFLYLSPERIQTDIFRERFARMKVSMVAIDEAHCISQWGYDFRPSYLQIAGLREIKPDVKFMALTATATPEVKADIIKHLKLNNPRVFQTSFARTNISLVVRKTENKDKKLLEILRKVPGPGLVYVRSRRATAELSRWLEKQDIKAQYYHAGMSFADRMARQEDWIANRTRVIAATNAFGMGIDKPDVRSVVHMDLPESLEAYYQEAGRAGRDGKKSYAALIFHDSDADALLAKVEQGHPTLDYLKKIYQALANYYQLAVGGSEGESFDFNLDDFSKRYGLRSAAVYAGLQSLEGEGLIALSEGFYRPSRVHIHMDKARVYEFQVASARFDPLIKTLLRLYGAELFSDFHPVSEFNIGRTLKLSPQEVHLELKQLRDLQVLHYVPASDKPQITFVLARQDAAYLPVDPAHLADRRLIAMKKAEAMIGFAKQDLQCRMQVLLEYFGETNTNPCGICDVCIDRKKSAEHESFQSYRRQILERLQQSSMTVDELQDQLDPGDKDLFIEVVRELVDQGLIRYDEFWVLRRT